MSWSYKPLWILLIEKDMKRTDLLRVAGLNPNALAKMGKGLPVSMNILEKLCKYFNCRIENIVEYVPDKQ